MPMHPLLLPVLTGKRFSIYAGLDFSEDDRWGWLGEEREGLSGEKVWWVGGNLELAADYVIHMMCGPRQAWSE